jgi:hypothetical protein
VPTPTPPPSADICTIAPNSALCQVLSPPTASEPVKPVQQASNEVIKTLSTSDGVPGSSSSGSSNSGGAATSATPDDSKKTDKVEATSDKTGTKNEPTKKTYCN